MLCSRLLLDLLNLPPVLLDLGLQIFDLGLEMVFLLVCSVCIETAYRANPTVTILTISIC